MALTHEQQALEQITRSKRILIITREHPTNDLLASAAACLLFLKKMGKEVEVVAPGVDPKTIPTVLAGREAIQPSVSGLRVMNVILDLKNVPLKELLYDVRDHKLEITLVPKHSDWQPTDVTFKHGNDRFDLVITLGATDMQSLGSLARDHADFLYRTTIVNIDHAATNENWGQINLLNLKAVSITESLYGLFEIWNRQAIDEPLATALLAGMIAETQSFRTPNVTPKTLSTAAQLVALGARREEIVHGLWRTRTIPTLKLWGRALSRLEQDRELGLIWTTLTRQDFLNTGTTEKAVDDVFHELLAYAPEAKVIAFFCESAAGDTAQLILHATTSYRANDIGRSFGAQGTPERAVATLSGKPLPELVTSALEQLKKTIKTG